MKTSSWSIVLATLLLALAILPSDAAAQAQPAEPSDEVKKLNEKAVRAIFDEDYVTAISLLDESLVVSEWNVTYLNLGRAYQLAGKCAKAKVALEKSKTAPPVKRPRPEVVNEKADKYLAELEESCSEEELAENATVTPEEKDTDESNEQETEQPTGEEEETAQSSELEEPEPTSEPEASGSGLRTLGYVLTGAGAVAAGSAVFFGLQARSIEDDINNRAEEGDPVPTDSITQSEFDDERQWASTFRTVSLSSAIASGVLVGAGLYFILSDTGAERTAVRLQAGPDAVGITFTTPF